DYDKATTFLEESRVAELKALYPDRNPHALAMARQNGFQSIQQFRDYILNQDRITVAATAIQRGVSPAKFYYELAQQRGWQGRGASRSGGRGSRGSSRGAGMDIAKLADLAVEDPDEFDKQWDRWAASQR